MSARILRILPVLLLMLCLCACGRAAEKKTVVVVREETPAPSVTELPVVDDKAVPPAETAAPTASGVNVTSPLPGNILSIKVSNGQSVKAGDVLIIIEAMKMENEVLAPQDGTVKQILVNKGAVVATGDVLIVI